VTIEEANDLHRRDRQGSSYGTANSDGNASGVSPIAVSYTLRAVFEIK
jgi:hypothetical protein